MTVFSSITLICINNMNLLKITLTVGKHWTSLPHTCIILLVLASNEYLIDIVLKCTYPNFFKRIYLKAGFNTPRDPLLRVCKRWTDPGYELNFQIDTMFEVHSIYTLL